MRRAISPMLTITALLLAAPVQAQAKRPAPMRYEIAPGPDGGSIKVTLKFRADADGDTKLELPSAFMGNEQLWRELRDIQVRGATISGEGPLRTLTSRPGQPITVRYRVVSGLDHEPTETDSYPSKPWIQRSWLFVDGASALAAVTDRPDAPVALKWRGWPAGYRRASNLEATRAVNPRAAVMIAGRDLRIVQSGPLRLAVRGRLAFADTALADDLATILKAERAFFTDPPAAPYFVAAAGVAASAAEAFRGTGKADAFAMITTPGMTLEDLRPLLAHEFFHAWNPGRLGKSIGPRGYWLSEGFTDFYARRLLRRAGLISPAAFAELWNESLRAYGVSPARTMPGARAAEAFWTDPDAEKIPYQRGAMLAAFWDWRLRQRGLSLDTILRAQAETFRKRPDAALTDLFVAETIRAGLDVAEDLTRHIDEGAMIELPQDVFAPCGKLETVTAPSFELGFEPQPTSDGLLKVARIKPGSAAYLVGLRDGMTIVRKISGTNGDSTRPYELLVRSTGGATQTIHFLPQGEGVVRYQRLVLDPAGGKTACDFQ